MPVACEDQFTSFFIPTGALPAFGSRYLNRFSAAAAKRLSLFTLFWLSLGPLLNLDLYHHHLNRICHPQSDSISAGNYLR